MSTEPTTRIIRLGGGRTRSPVPATLIRHLSASELPKIERKWSPARTELFAALVAAGQALEHAHWDWRQKVGSATKRELVAVEAEGRCQGLMAVLTDARPAILTPGHEIIYVDYLETAPWNLALGGRTPEFLGVGTVLIGEAVLLSQERGHGGRIGLHALPQAVGFYAVNCGMASTGRDAGYYDLPYFEYADGGGPAFRAAKGLV